MDKNTIWAIALSTLVIIGAFVIQPMLFPQNQQIVTEQAAESESTEPTALESADSSMFDVNVIKSDDAEVEQQNYTVKTDKIEVIFTNKGGDIISYKLLDHNDVDTKDYVQLADNISDFNRTCSLSLGTSDMQFLMKTSTQKLSTKIQSFSKNHSITTDEKSHLEKNILSSLVNIFSAWMF